MLIAFYLRLQGGWSSIIIFNLTFLKESHEQVSDVFLGLGVSLISHMFRLMNWLYVTFMWTKRQRGTEPGKKIPVCRLSSSDQIIFFKFGNIYRLPTTYLWFVIKLKLTAHTLFIEKIIYFISFSYFEIKTLNSSEGDIKHKYVCSSIQADWD